MSLRTLNSSLSFVKSMSILKKSALSNKYGSAQIFRLNMNLIRFAALQATSKVKSDNSKFIKLLKKYKISEFSGKENPWLNEIDPSSLSFKLNLLDGMNFKNIAHAIPFLRISPKTLVSMLKVTKRDQNNNYCDNRLYYLAEKLDADPQLLASKISRRTFIYQLSFDWLKSSLETCLEYGVPKERILKDLWVLKYYHETIRGRLEKAKQMGRSNLAPWMVRCQEDVLDRSLQISKTTSTVLGDYVSTQDYLTERLKTTPEAISDIFDRIPAMKYRRASKFKNILDYLFSQGFTEADILQCVRILLHSLSTTRTRLETLKSLGIEVKNLNVLCKTEKNFKRFLELVKYAPKPEIQTQL